jgi:hypothetical protein
VLALLPLSSAVAADGLLFGVDAGIGESDNITLAPNNKVSQTIATTDFDFSAKQQTRLLDLSATGNFSYLDYLQNAYGNQFAGRFDGNAQIALVPERLTWAVQDNFGQSALDPFVPTTPANLQNVNYFSTGPNLSLRLGGTSFIDLSARYARVQYQTSPYNSNRLIGNVAWGLRLSQDSSVAVNADSERVMFANTMLNTDFDRTNAFVSYQIQGARTDLSAQLGATRVSQGNTSQTGGLATAQLSRKVSAASKLTLSVGRQLTDAGSSFSVLQSGATGVVGAAPAPQTADSFTNTYASAGWDFERNRTTLGLSGRWDQNVYDHDPALDYNREGLEFRVGRRLTQSFSAQLLGRLYHTDYVHALVGSAGTGLPSQASSTFTDGMVGAIFTWHHGRGLEVNLRGEHSSRDATGQGTGYRENRVYLTIGYRPKPVQTQFPTDAPAT